MLKEICGIKLCGANFENPTRLDMFNPIDGGTQKTIKKNRTNHYEVESNQ